MADPDAFLLELLEAEHAYFALASDEDAGRVPRGARRGLQSFEIAGKVNFAGLVDDQAAILALLLREVTAARAEMGNLIRTDLGQSLSANELSNRVGDLFIYGINGIYGAPALIQASQARIYYQLQRMVALAAARVRAEASLQGVAIPDADLMNPDSEAVLGRQASRLARLPHSDLLRAVSEGAALRIEPSGSVSKALGIVDEAGRSLSEKPLANLAGQATSGATGIGRITGAEAAPEEPRNIYASELLDSNTCDPCYHVDGKEYPSLAALSADYYAGTYVRCEGGMACRGTPVFVWGTEAP